MYWDHFPIGAVPSLAADKPIDLKANFEGTGGKRVTWRLAKAVDERGQINLGRIYSEDELAAFGYAEIQEPAPADGRMAVGSDDTLTVWLNGKQVYDFADRRGFDHEQQRFDVTLRQGTNRLLIRCGNRGGAGNSPSP